MHRLNDFVLQNLRFDPPKCNEINHLKVLNIGTSILPTKVNGMIGLLGTFTENFARAFDESIDLIMKSKRP